MTLQDALLFQRVATDVKGSIDCIAKPASDIVAPVDQPVIPHSVFRSSRGYLERIVYQINATYRATSYDACAVMVRRLVEVLIIEAFEANDIADRIVGQDGDYLYLSDLITNTLNESSWNLGRNTKHGLRRLKDIGDRSAHSRRYNAKREYIDEVVIPLRDVCEELLYLAKIKR